MEEKTVCQEINYKREYEVLQLQNHFLNEQLEKYKQALLNVCLKGLGN